MELAGDAGPAVLDRLAPKRASPKEGAHKAVQPGDKRLQASKLPVPVCEQTREKVKRGRELWAEKVFEVATETIATYEGRACNHS